MLIFRGLNSTDKKPVALTIGNFDGVHLGHQALLKQLKITAQLLGLPTAVLVFEPHPREFFTPLEAPARLTSMREKLELFATLDVDRIYVCRFNSSFSQMSAVDFVHALSDKLAAKFVLIGDDFRFGSRRTGDFALMEKIGSQQGFKVENMHSVSHNGVRISSTAVRAVLVEGDLQAAQRYLGRPYSISGRVVHGDGLGKQLGFPTANIQLKHNRPPLTGIFVVRVQGDDLPLMQGVASLGVRPTVKQNGKPVLEVHLFDFSGKIYNKHLRVDFLHKLRDEVKYFDLHSLTQQIELDVRNAKQWFIQHD
ncbi:bifunctional riboflavin kinase/FMN adenylyltransferase [Candidatus Nitrotoga sp. HW29]|uniref:bifunctional riboflavin kinase/FAD synthetase n=1 Tax=Candidatus Nitrotoga sp. HW29 TaxID=2886963 RepID=UPI001EF3244E|nr:bifunctional riboflavin kinase/FAD synthetase [Candidatus Nitrotoga sp. HW29]CAH1904144.1 bifunctional riboflavin kinase/FMN adenylyltransferase [Candidatus Nitrotoga sp. HW29]